MGFWAYFVLSSADSVVWNWVHRLGGPGLVILGLVSSAIPLPGSLDVFTILLSAHNRSWWPYYGFMATLGAVLGGYLTYRLAEKGGEETLEKEIGKDRAKKVYKKFERQGGFWVFLGSILPPPFPIVPFLMAAGILQYPRKKFLSVLAAGRGVRFFVVAYVAHLYGRQIVQLLSQYYRPVLYGLVAVAVLGSIGALMYWKWYLPRKEEREQARKRQKTGEAPHPEHKVA